MERLDYESAFIFKYSPRPGARSAEWPETVSEEEKTRRITLLIEEQKARSLRKNEIDVGRTVEVLVEGQTKRSQDEWFGKSAHFKTTVFPHRGERIGDLLRVSVAAATPHAILGEGVRTASCRDGGRPGLRRTARAFLSSPRSRSESRPGDSASRHSLPHRCHAGSAPPSLVGHEDARLP